MGRTFSRSHGLTIFLRSCILQTLDVKRYRLGRDDYMLNGKNILVIGARTGGYGAAIARAAVQAGASVYGTTLTPEDPKEQSFFEELGAVLLDVPLRFDANRRTQVFESLAEIEGKLRDHGVPSLDGVVHTAAGGFPRHPSVMKAVGDILKGKQTFFDMATPVKRNVYYVNAGSFEDTIAGLSGLCHEQTHYLALTYRGALPYFIAHTKRYLERLAAQLAQRGKRTIVAALPEAWTQSSQFFTGIEIAVIYNYLKDLKDVTDASESVEPLFREMKEGLSRLDDLNQTLAGVEAFLAEEWESITLSDDPALLSDRVGELFHTMRWNGTFQTLRRAVEIISKLVREASGIIVVNELLGKGRYQPGEIRQVYYRDLAGMTRIEKADPPVRKVVEGTVRREWLHFDKEDIRKTLSMYGENFLFLDRVVMEVGEVRDGMIGFARYTVPTPDENPILKDHFVDIPLFGGHLQMEAVAQLGTFMVLKLLKDHRLVPILTGTEFPDLDTMAPPGEKLTMMGVIRMAAKRELRFEAFIENRYARSKGVIRGMVVNQRVIRKMLTSFNNADSPG